MRGVCKVLVGAIFPFPDLNIFYRGVAASGIRVSDVCGFEEVDVGFMSGGLCEEGSGFSERTGAHDVRESKELPSTAITKRVGM
jgi:hypothetical protein